MQDWISLAETYAAFVHRHRRATTGHALAPKQGDLAHPAALGTTVGVPIQLRITTTS